MTVKLKILFILFLEPQVFIGSMPSDSPKHQNQNVMISHVNSNILIPLKPEDATQNSNNPMSRKMTINNNFNYSKEIEFLISQYKN